MSILPGMSLLRLGRKTDIISMVKASHMLALISAATAGEIPVLLFFRFWIVKFLTNNQNRSGPGITK
jgi:presenilin-like A22 family membrane protease